VIGGGYIGLEAAASGRALGAEVVVLEREPRRLARVACEVLSSFFLAYHEARGVTFQLGADIVSIEGEAGKITGVRLSDGRIITCDTALVGVGALPNDGLAREAGIDGANGIVVDLEARTSDRSVFAIVGRPAPTPEVTWNWSDQYDLTDRWGAVRYRREPGARRSGRRQVRGVPSSAGRRARRRSRERGAVARDRLTDTSIPMKRGRRLMGA
jgi:NADPH-dependent 2,4-dienoyl-CoA reductase/sulfur reductase-like enzyme